MRQRALVLALAIFAPCVAHAADVPVSYTVEDRPFKTAIAGTSLTFALYNDAACTTLVDSEIVAAENVSLILKLKQHTPANDVKLPKTMELRTTLAGVAAATPLFLKVTGTGVVPVGGACQAQAAGVQGPSGALPRTVFVPADGTPAANGAALLAAAAGITGDIARPTTLQLDDGEYDIGTTTLALSGIVLAGRSPEHTTITAGGSSTLTDTAGGAVRTNSNVHDLKLNVNGGGATYAAAIVFVGFGSITNTHIDVSGNNSHGIWNVFGTLAARNVRINVMSALGSSFGIRNDWLAFGAVTRVHESKVFASSSDASEGDAVISDGGDIRVTNSILEGLRYARANAGSVRLRNCGLSGVPSGTLTCLASTTALNAYTNTCPAESWGTVND